MLEPGDTLVVYSEAECNARNPEGKKFWIGPFDGSMPTVLDGRQHELDVDFGARLALRRFWLFSEAKPAVSPS